MDVLYKGIFETYQRGNCYDQFKQAEDKILKAAELLSKYYEDKLYMQPDSSALVEFTFACKSFGCEQFTKVLYGGFNLNSKYTHCYVPLRLQWDAQDFTDLVGYRDFTSTKEAYFLALANTGMLISSAYRYLTNNDPDQEVWKDVQREFQAQLSFALNDFNSDMEQMKTSSQYPAQNLINIVDRNKQASLEELAEKSLEALEKLTPWQIWYVSVNSYDNAELGYSSWKDESQFQINSNHKTVYAAAFPKNFEADELNYNCDEPAESFTKCLVDPRTREEKIRSCTEMVEYIAKYDYVESFEVDKAPTLNMSKGIEIYKSADHIESSEKP